MNKKIEIVYDIYIAAPVAQVWKGIVDGDLTKHYVYGTRFEGKLEKGAPYAYLGEGGFKIVDGAIAEVDPGKRVVMTWKAHWDDSVAKDSPSRVAYTLSAMGPATTRLHLVHDQFDSQNATYSGSVDGWPLMLSSLKTLLETGKPLATK